MRRQACLVAGNGRRIGLLKIQLHALGTFLAVGVSALAGGAAVALIETLLGVKEFRLGWQ